MRKLVMPAMPITLDSRAHAIVETVDASDEAVGTSDTEKPEAQELSDSNVVLRVLSGDTEFFEILIRRYNQRLFRVLRGYVRSDDDVMDTMQDTYLKAYLNLNQFRLDSSFSTWLIRIGINEALQRIRKNRNSLAMEEEQMAQFIVDLAVGAENYTPESETLNAELGSIITAAIDKIPAKYRVVFIMAEVEGMSQLAIGECLHISGSNVKVRLHRAKHLIKDEMLKLVKNASVLEFGSIKCDTMVQNVMRQIA